MKSQETRTVVKKRDEGASWLMRRVSRVQSLAQVAIAVVMYKLKRGGVGRRGAQCAVACRAAFFLVVGCCRGSAFACKAAGQAETSDARPLSLLPGAAFTSQRQKEG